MSRDSNILGKRLNSEKKPGEGFPSYLYVHEPLEASPERFEGCRKLEDVEEDDTVAIYKLEKVCRIKIKKEIVMVDEREIASYERATRMMSQDE